MYSLYYLYYYVRLFIRTTLKGRIKENKEKGNRSPFKITFFSFLISTFFFFKCLNMYYIYLVYEKKEFQIFLELKSKI